MNHCHAKGFGQVNLFLVQLANLLCVLEKMCVGYEGTQEDTELYFKKWWMIGDLIFVYFTYLWLITKYGLVSYYMWALVYLTTLENE